VTPDQDQLGRMIRQSHHLARARLWLEHAVAAAAFGVPVWLVGVLSDWPALELSGGLMCAASWVCSKVSDRHSNAAKRQ